MSIPVFVFFKLFDNKVYLDDEFLFELDIYPDGQKNISISEEIFNKIPVDNKKYRYLLVTSVKNFSELESFLCFCKFLENNEIKLNDIYFEYLFGMRSDRKFSKNGISYFKDILIPILSEIKCKEIHILNPHHLKSEEMAKKFINERYEKFYSFRHYEELKGHCDYYTWDEIDTTCLKEPIFSDEFYIRDLRYDKNFNIIPDNKIIYIGADESISNHIGFKSFFVKRRMDDKVYIEDLVIGENDIKILDENCIVRIVDDLIDGGRTHIECAKFIIDRNIKYKELELFCFHAILSNDENIKKLSDLYDNVFISNSYKNFTNLPDNFIVINRRNVND